MDYRSWNAPSSAILTLPPAYSAARRRRPLAPADRGRGSHQAWPGRHERGLRMAGRDIIVIGASAGGVQALQELAKGLPHDLPAAVFVVVHTSPTSPGILPQILDRAGPLPCHHARDGDAIRPGR